MIKRVHKPARWSRSAARPVRSDDRRQACVVEYEPDTRPARHRAGAASRRRAASRRSSAARCCHTPRMPGSTSRKTAIGYEISFTRYFYKPQPLRTLEEIRADILALEKETEGLLADIIGATPMIDELTPIPYTRTGSAVARRGAGALGSPAQWPIVRSASARRVSRTAHPEVSIRTGVRIRDDGGNGARKQEMPTDRKYQRALRGDIAYNMMRMWQGGGRHRACGWTCQSRLCRLRGHSKKLIAPTTPICSALPAYMREIDTFSRGIVPRSQSALLGVVEADAVGLSAARRAAADRAVSGLARRTDGELIRAKQKTIALLNEQKQAIIHRAVTRGLDPNVRLKPSGIPWLGDVPEGWEVTCLQTSLRSLLCKQCSDKRITRCVFGPYLCKLCRVAESTLRRISPLLAVTVSPDETSIRFPTRRRCHHLTSRTGRIGCAACWSDELRLTIQRVHRLSSPA